MENHFQRQKLGGQVRNRKQAGFLSIEAIAVVFFIVVGLALAASRTDMLGGGSEASEEVSNIQTLYTNTKALKGSGGYGASGTDLTSQLVTNGGVPKSMSVVSGVIYNSFGGTVTVVSTGVGFTITSNAVSGSACNKAATKISRGGAFYSTKIGANAAVVGEVTAAVASTQCASSNNTLAYTSAS